MVSFFGLRLGGDKKKSQNRQTQKKPPEQWDRIDQNTLGQGQYFGHNFSRPHIPSSRPGTSSSMRSMSNWRAAFKSPAATSSMVDLTAPNRRPSVGSLRQNASDANLRMRFGNDSSVSVALPTALGGMGNRPGVPERPKTSSARTKEWVNPLDVHFVKDPSSSRPATPLASTALGSKSPLGQFEFGIQAGASSNDVAGKHKHTAEQTNENGYPSPPQSVENDDRAFSPTSPVSPRNTNSIDARPSSSRRNAPSALRNVDIGARSLPSPAASVVRTSEERLEAPVIRNIQARRDTATFHQPRRRSFTMEVDEAQEEKRKQREAERAKHQTTQLFAGNFAAFDFGEIVPKASPDLQKEENKNTNLERSANTTEAPKSNYLAAAQEAPRERQFSEASSTVLPIQRQDSPPPSKPQLPTPPEHTHPNTLSSASKPTGHRARSNTTGPPSAAAGAHPGSSKVAFDVAPQGFKSRMESDARARGPPQELQMAPPFLADREHMDKSPRSPFGPPPAEDNYMRGNDAPPPRRPGDKAPSSPFSKPSKKEGKVPSSRGLPRGRQPEPPRRPARPEESPAPEIAPAAEERSLLSLSDWDADRFDSSDPHRSAIPPPLATIKTTKSNSSGPAGESEGWTPTSTTAPRLPSPTFPSLEKSISNSGDSFGAPFELSFDSFSFDQPLMSPVLGEFHFPAPERGLGSVSPRRVDAHKAPPRPPPITLPPSPGRDANGQADVVIRSPVKSPVVTQKESQFHAGFI